MFALVLAAGLLVPSVPPIAAPLSAPIGLIIAGAPGSGKGTQGTALARELGLVHISVGDLLRARAAIEPDLAEIMRRGALVPASLVVSVVRERLSQADVAEKGFILDGFPRRPEEALALEQMMAEGLPLDAVIRLEVAEAELRRRILGRGRADDTEQAFLERMRVYRAQTLPAIEAAARLSKEIRPDVSASEKDVNARAVREAVLAAVPKARARVGR